MCQCNCRCRRRCPCDRTLLERILDVLFVDPDCPCPCRERCRQRRYVTYTTLTERERTYPLDDTYPTGRCGCRCGTSRPVLDGDEYYARQYGLDYDCRN